MKEDIHDDTGSARHVNLITEHAFGFDSDRAASVCVFVCHKEEKLCRKINFKEESLPF